MIEVYKLLTGK